MERTLIAGILVASLLLFIHLARRPTHSIDEATFNRLKKGMTRDEVAGLFRTPPGDYTTRRVLYIPPPGRGRGWQFWGGESSIETWASDEIKTSIYFDHDDRVAEMALYLQIMPNDSVWDRFSGWFFHR